MRGKVIWRIHYMQVVYTNETGVSRQRLHGCWAAAQVVLKNAFPTLHSFSLFFSQQKPTHTHTVRCMCVGKVCASKCCGLACDCGNIVWWDGLWVVSNLCVLHAAVSSMVVYIADKYPSYCNYMNMHDKNSIFSQSP